MTKLTTNIKNSFTKRGISIQGTNQATGLLPSLYRLGQANIKVKTIYDIGAHDGSWSRQVSEFLGGDALFFLFEPNTSHNSELKKLGFQIFNEVLSDQVKDVDWFGLGGYGDSYFREKSEFYESHQPVIKTTSTLNSIIEIYDLPIPDLIKIDTQGSEIDIINGANRFIRDVKLVILECPIVEYNYGAPNMFEYLSTMESYGFEPIDVTEVHRINGVLVQIDIIFKMISK